MKLVTLLLLVFVSYVFSQNGACCTNIGVCLDVNGEVCDSLNGDIITSQFVNGTCQVTIDEDPVVTPEQICVAINNTILATNYQGDDTNCQTSSCSFLVGSCCVNAQCIPNINSQICANLNGTYNGDGSNCTNNKCNCVEVTPQQCSNQNGFLIH